MQKPNIASRLLMALGIGDALRNAIPKNHNGAVSPRIAQGGSTRFRRSEQKHDRLKAEFDDLMAAQYEPPKHIKLARKAHMGTIGLPHGRRGLMVRSVDGVLRITS